jgi:uncharacterized protein (DUF1786 family)
MSRFLLIDIGAGTMDVLYYDTETDLHYKAVVKSPVRYVAERAAEITGDLLVTGVEMGGGQGGEGGSCHVRIVRSNHPPQPGQSPILGHKNR